MQTASALCSTCSSELPSGASFCPRCGSATPTNLSGGGVSYRPPEAGADAARHQELQRLLGDGYELRGLIGRGGFADVFEAWDVRLKRPLAIKTLRNDLDVSESLLERFRREAEAIARLRHPNVIPIYAVGGEGSVAYFVMPKIDGASLAARLQTETKLDVDESCRILRESASALAAAHEAGMIHRDVKPENIMLDGPQRRVQVTDFGIAKNAGPTDKGLTGTGVMIGTPHYMSPEQATGERTIDHRSDQYSLAVVGYRILSGQLPFDGESTQSLIFRQVTEMPPPLTQVAPDVPAAISDVIQKALSKDPRERFSSIEAFNRAIGAATSGAPVLVGRRQRVEDLATRIAAMRRSLPGWKSPLAAVALLLGLAGSWMVARSESPVANQLAANRDDAVFAARTFLVGRGVLPPFREAAVFESTTDPKYRFLWQTAPNTIDHRAATDAPVWHWHIKVLPDADKTATWHVEVGPGNRILGFRRAVADTLSAQSLSAAEAQPIALRELSARVTRVADLEPIADSTVRLANRVDHIFRWRRPATAIPWRTDTSFSRVNVRVTGSQVSSYTEELVLPRGWGSPALESLGFGLLLVALLGTLIALVWQLVQQMRRDELQWATALRFGIVIVLAGLPAWFVAGASDAFVIGTTEGTSADAPPVLDVLAQLLLRVLGVCAWTLLAVMVESLGAELRPRSFAGIADLLRGRFKTPEFVSGVVNGGLGGVAMLVAVGAAGFVSYSMTGAPPSADTWTVVTSPFPVLQALETIAREMLPALGIALAQLAALRFFGNNRWAFIVPAVLLPVILVTPALSSSTVSEILNAVIRLLVLYVVVWRYGALAGGVAGWLSVAIPSLVTMFAYSSGGMMDATLAAAVYATPFVLAVVAYRHLTSPDPVRVGRTTTA